MINRPRKSAMNTRIMKILNLLSINLLVARWDVVVRRIDFIRFAILLSGRNSVMCAGKYVDKFTLCSKKILYENRFECLSVATRQSVAHAYVKISLIM